MSRGKRMVEIALQESYALSEPNFEIINVNERNHLQSEQSLNIAGGEEIGLLINPDDELYKAIIESLPTVQPTLDAIPTTSNVFELTNENTVTIVDHTDAEDYINSVIESVADVDSNADIESNGDTETDAEGNLIDNSMEAGNYLESQEVPHAIVSTRKRRQQAQSQRVLGKAYQGYKKTEGKIFQNCSKEPRKLKCRCGHKMITKKNERSFLCGQFSEEDRQQVFERFWRIKSWSEKIGFVRGLVSSRGIRKRRKVADKENNEDVTKKNCGYDIYLGNKSDSRVRVCRKFFINTLCIGEDTFKRWVKELPIDVNNESEDIEENEKAMKNNSRKRRKVENVDNIIEWLNILPKVPSHYCRKSSSKIYVESTFRSSLHMYSVYSDWCNSKNVKSASRTLFNETLKAEKIAIHLPRKDQCDLCYGYKVHSVTEEEYQIHLKKKNDARAAKNAAKEEANESNLVITMDLQSVLLCPKLLNSSLYYKQKLQLHNFTIFSLNNKDVTLYVWHEANGGVSANEFTSCIIDFLSNIDESYKSVTLVSDGCNYQNRNKVLASALSDFSILKSITIQQLYLEKGHTMMEADSVHASLEQYFKPPINSPSDYVARMRQARSKHPYDVKVVDYNFFKNYEQLNSNLPSLRPGKKQGDPVVTDIRQLKYTPDGEIEFKIDHTSNWQKLLQRRKNLPPFHGLKSKYKTSLPISESKFRHLQELKGVIEADHHAFYDNLKYKPDKK